MFQKKKIEKLYFVYNPDKRYTIAFNLFKAIDYRSFYALNKNLHLFNYRHKQKYFYFTHNIYGHVVGEIDTCIESLQSLCKELFNTYKWHCLLHQKQLEIESLQKLNKTIDEFVSSSLEHDEVEVSIRQLVGLNNQRLKKRNETVTHILDEHKEENETIANTPYYFARKFLHMTTTNVKDKETVELYILHLLIDDIEIEFEND